MNQFTLTVSYRIKTYFKMIKIVKCNDTTEFSIICMHQIIFKCTENAQHTNYKFENEEIIHDKLNHHLMMNWMVL